MHTSKNTGGRAWILLAATCASLCMSKAWAQSTASTSSVSLYGVVDLNAEHINHHSALSPRAPGYPGTAHSRTSMRSGGLTGSQWGLRGSEDLGGGLRASFVLESGVDMSKGALLQGGRAFGRQSFVGLEGSWGKLMLGRQYTSMFSALRPFSPLAYATQYEPIILLTGLNFRSDNTIKWDQTWGPASGNVRALAHWTFKSGVSGLNADKPGDPFRRDTGFGAALAYNSPRWNATLAYDQSNAGMSTFGDPHHGKARKWMLGVNWSNGPLKLIGGWRWQNAHYGNGQPFLRDDLMWLGLSYQPNPRWHVALVYYRDNIQQLGRKFGEAATNPANPWQLSFVTTHALSKRTDLYVTAAYAKHAGLNFDTSPINYANGYYLGAGQNNMLGYAFGIRHRF